MAAVTGVAESHTHYQALCQNAEPDSILNWEAEMTLASEARLNSPGAMDIYASQIESRTSASICSFPWLTHSEVPTQAQKQLELTEEEVTLKVGGGTAAWLAEGLKIEEAQYVAPRVCPVFPS